MTELAFGADSVNSKEWQASAIDVIYVLLLYLYCFAGHFQKVIIYDISLVI